MYMHVVDSTHKTVVLQRTPCYRLIHLNYLTTILTPSCIKEIVVNRLTARAHRHPLEGIIKTIGGACTQSGPQLVTAAGVEKTLGRALPTRVDALRARRDATLGARRDAYRARRDALNVRTFIGGEEQLASVRVEVATSVIVAQPGIICREKSILNSGSK